MKKKAVVFKHVKNRNEQYAYLTSVLKSESNLSECAVLYRNNISAIPLVDYLEYNNIPFYIRDTNLHFFLDPCDIEAFGQIYYKISREMGRTD